MLKEKTVLTDFGCNCETGEIDLALGVALNEDGIEIKPVRLPKSSLTPMKLLPTQRSDRGLSEVNDEISFWHEAPPIGPGALDVLQDVHAMVQDVVGARSADRPDGRHTILNAICVNVATGILSIRFRLVVIRRGKEVSSAWHRTTVEPGGDVVEQIAHVNGNITTTLFAKPVEKSMLPLLWDVCRRVQTPEVIAAHKARQRREATQSEIGK